MKWLTLVLTYLPTVLSCVQAVEAVFANSPGAAKKQLVMNAIQAGAASGEKIPEAHVQGISTLIDNVVGTLNASGIFNKSAAAPVQKTA
jgi:hypothetical protein